MSEEGTCCGLGEGSSRRKSSHIGALGMAEEEGNEAEPSREIGRAQITQGLVRTLNFFLNIVEALGGFQHALTYDRKKIL